MTFMFTFFSVSPLLFTYPDDYLSPGFSPRLVLVQSYVAGVESKNAEINLVSLKFQTQHLCSREYVCLFVGVSCSFLITFFSKSRL